LPRRSREAVLTSGEMQYYKETNNTYMGTQNPVQSTSYVWKSVEANMTLSITPYVSEWQAVSFDARIGLVVAIFSLIAIMCLSWLYTICVVIAEAFPVKNVASVVGITAGAGAVGGAVFNERKITVSNDPGLGIHGIQGIRYLAD